MHAKTSSCNARYAYKLLEMLAKEIPGSMKEAF